MSHKIIFSVTKKEIFSLKFPEKLDGESLLKHWNSRTTINLNHYKETDNKIQLFLEGGTGNYNKTSGVVDYEIYKKRPIRTFLRASLKTIKFEACEFFKTRVYCCK